MPFRRFRWFVLPFFGLLVNVTLGAVEEKPSDTPAGPADIGHARQLMQQGKYAEAEKELTALVRSDEQTSGPQSPQALADRLELAITQGKIDQPIKAEEEVRALLAIFVRRSGPEQEETLRCQTALAELLTEWGRSHEAIKEYRQILEIRIRTGGADGLEAARVRHSLGDALALTRNYEEAIRQYGEAEPVLEKLLGAEHAETLFNRTNRALAEGERRDFEAAEKELREVLAVRERLLGPNDFSVLRTCYDLGRILGGHGHLDEALTYATRAATGLRADVGPSNPAAVQAEGLCREIQSDLARSQADHKSPK